MAVREHENLTRTNLLKVIGLLEQEKPITKKAACEILNISYNTARLKKLIDEFKAKEVTNKKLRAKLRGTPLSEEELRVIANEYLNGEPLSGISEFLHRPVSLIKKGLSTLGIPERNAEHTYTNPPMLEDHAIREEYEKDDLVYSARYGEPALIDKRYDTKDGPIYAIYVLGKYQCSAMQPYWELGDLTHAQKNLNLNILPKEGLKPAYNPR